MKNVNVELGSDELSLLHFVLQGECGKLRARAVGGTDAEERAFWVKELGRHRALLAKVSEVLKTV